MPLPSRIKEVKWALATAFTFWSKLTLVLLNQDRHCL